MGRRHAVGQGYGKAEPITLYYTLEPSTRVHKHWENGMGE